MNASPPTTLTSPEAGAGGRPLRIGIFGYYGTENLGNDGTLSAVLAMLNRIAPGADITCICKGPERVAAQFGIRAVAINRSRPQEGLAATIDRVTATAPSRLLGFLDALHVLRDLDLVVAGGTGLLDDFSDRPSGMAYRILKWTLSAKAARRPFSMVAIGAGPIRNPMSRRMMIAAAKMARFRSYRDALSRDFLASCGVDVSGDLVTPDLVFGSPPPCDDALPAAERLIVGLGVMDYFGWRGGDQAAFEAYVSKITAFAGHVLRAGHGLRLLIGQRSDQVAVDAVLEGLRDGGHDVGGVIAETPATLDELMNHIAQTHLVVATRFHNVVCALKLGRPVISLSYARKNDVLLEDFGLGAYARPCDAFDVAWLNEAFDRLRLEAGPVRQRILARREEYRAQLAALEGVLSRDLIAPLLRARGA